MTAQHCHSSGRLICYLVHSSHVQQTASEFWQLAPFPLARLKQPSHQHFSQTPHTAAFVSFEHTRSLSKHPPCHTPVTFASGRWWKLGEQVGFCIELPCSLVHITFLEHVQSSSYTSQYLQSAQHVSGTQ